MDTRRSRDCPFYHLVPKDMVANLHFRKQLIQMGSESKANALQLWRMCARDILFYINTFVWTYDPRKPDPAVPFVTWEYQDPVFLQMARCIANEDLLIEKSRDMGALWMCLTVFEWRWHFRPLQAFLLTSRTEDLVDKRNDPDALFWKLDFILQNQPQWMRPAVTRNNLTLYNEDNGSAITGASTTTETARGGRRTAILMDEFASVPDGYSMLRATRDVTNCRIFNSTPKGTANAFYDLSHSTDVRKLRFHWTMHPEKSVGMYTVDVQPAVGAKVRSPWYDKQCARAANRQEIAQELDIDYAGSDYQFFEPNILQKITQRDARPPLMIGELEYDLISSRPLKFIEHGRGRMKLWTPVTKDGNPRRDRNYTVGVDVSSGTGATPSAVVVLDNKSGEQVAEYADATIRPEALADFVIALCRWFEGENGLPAYLIWEANGPGRSFGSRAVDRGFRHIYYRRNDASITRRRSDIPGWFSNKESKFDLLSKYRAAMISGVLIIRSKEQLDDCRDYVYLPNGSIEHSRAAASPDPSGAKEHHGDRATAAALCQVARHKGGVIEARKVVTPVGSLAWRRKMREEATRELQYKW